jgi:hypothetical protein
VRCRVCCGQRTSKGLFHEKGFSTVTIAAGCFFWLFWGSQFEMYQTK